MNSPIFLVGLGGIFGSIMRYLVVMLFNGSPLAAIVINLSGCFLIGVINAFISLYFPFNQSYRLFLLTGIIGSFTTFSAFGLDGFNFLKDGYIAKAFFYITAQVLIGLWLVYFGDVLVRKVSVMISLGY